MKTLMLPFLLLLAGCANSTGPQALGNDPSVLITNTAGATLFFTWQDGQGVIGGDTIPSGIVDRCIRFLARPDSAYFHVAVTSDKGTSTITAPWFNPSARPAWTVRASPNANGSPLIIVADTTVAC